MGLPSVMLFMCTLRLGSLYRLTSRAHAERDLLRLEWSLEVVYFWTINSKRRGCSCPLISVQAEKQCLRRVVTRIKAAGTRPIWEGFW
ncbi:hypothetical protein B0H34DRAFT_700830 [Crassisporium funariophilum]|nr:hypothetical protein B0H34DRAFT_700830 [Crassisporium funariophilum]